MAITLRAWYVRGALKRLTPNLRKPFNFYDAGCGSGDFIFPFAKKYPGSYFTGADKSESNIKLCQRYSAYKNLGNTKFLVRDLEKPPGNIKADVISCITVLQYVPDDIKALENFHKILKDDGILLLYIPVNGRYHFRFYKRLRESASNVDYDVIQEKQRTYTPEEIREKLSGAGFKIRDLEFSYGRFGRIAYELHSSVFLLVQKYPLAAFLPCAIIFICLLPINLLLMSLDYFSNNREGNGMLILAEKK